MAALKFWFRRFYSFRSKIQNGFSEIDAFVQQLKNLNKCYLVPHQPHDGRPSRVRRSTRHAAICAAAEISHEDPGLEKV